MVEPAMPTVWVFPETLHQQVFYWAFGLLQAFGLLRTEDSEGFFCLSIFKVLKHNLTSAVNRTCKDLAFLSWSE